tara:strand:- start:539 stop:874 length:336 start_codon:yes stop_codon:yes gene_type:complete
MPSSWEDILDNIGDFSAYQLEATPSLAYFSASPFSDNTSQAQQQYWQGQYGNVQSQYMGELGGALRSGEQAPSFVDFLSDMPFTERYSSLSPTVRPGSSFRRFAPTTRFLY